MKPRHKEMQENCREGETLQILRHPSPSSAAPLELDAADCAQARQSERDRTGLFGCRDSLFGVHWPPRERTAQN